MTARAIRLLLAVLVLALLGVGSAQAATLPVVPSHLRGGPFVVEPAQINLTGHDDKYLLGGIGHHYGQITWSYWSAKSAGGTGVIWLNDCIPTCRQKGTQGWRVRLWLWHPRLLNGRWMFTQLRYKLRHDVPSWSWADGGALTFRFYLNPRPGWN